MTIAKYCVNVPTPWAIGCIEMAKMIAANAGADLLPCLLCPFCEQSHVKSWRVLGGKYLYQVRCDCDAPEVSHGPSMSSRDEAVILWNAGIRN